MVTHDYERGVISGLPKSVLDHVRRTGQLPDDAMSVNLRAVWEGLLWQKSHAAEPPGMTVAEILRVRDGWDDAFDPEAWERMTGGKVPFSPGLDGVKGLAGPGDGRSVVALFPRPAAPAPQDGNEAFTGILSQSACNCVERQAKAFWDSRDPDVTWEFTCVPWDVVVLPTGNSLHRCWCKEEMYFEGMLVGTDEGSDVVENYPVCDGVGVSSDDVVLAREGIKKCDFTLDQALFLSRDFPANRESATLVFGPLFVDATNLFTAIYEVTVGPVGQACQVIMTWDVDCDPDSWRLSIVGGCPP